MITMFRESCVDRKSVLFHQCMFGLADVQSGELHRKRTRVMSNSEHILSELDRTCSKDHRHQHLMGKVKHEGKWQSRSRIAPRYPEEMCQAVISGVLREKTSREQSCVQHSVLVLESLDDDESDSRIMRTRQVHENLGHPIHSEAHCHAEECTREGKSGEACQNLDMPSV